MPCMCLHLLTMVGDNNNRTLVSAQEESWLTIDLCS